MSSAKGQEQSSYSLVLHAKLPCLQWEALFTSVSFSALHNDLPVAIVGEPSANTIAAAANGELEPDARTTTTSPVVSSA